VKEAMQKLELEDDVHGRENLAGAHITAVLPPKQIYDIALDDPMDPEAIALILLNAVHGGLSPEEQLGFDQFRDYLTLLERPARESRINREIDQKIIVGSGSRIVRLLAVHNKSAPNGSRST
jgi:hypothetical protein